MSYLVLARKWRPQRFEDVIGQEHVVRTLSNAITNNRLAHAYLFTGARGVGKTSVARILAKALNCEKGPAPTPCNSCSHCNEITSGSNVDVLEIDGASNTGVDDVRELRENVRYLPQSSRYRIYIIDEVHMLSVAAFNALLKTLEEPPPHVIFIFATTEPHKIPATILSRCQRFDFSRIPRMKLLAGLDAICRNENISIDSSDLAVIAYKSEGSVRDALSLLDQLVSFAGKEVPKGEVARALGIVDRTWVAEMAEAVLSSDASRALPVVDRAFNHGYNLRELLRELIIFIRDVAVVKETDNPAELLDLPNDEIEAIKTIAEKIYPEKLQAIFGILMKADEHMNRVQDSRSILEMAVIKATHAEPLLPVAEAIERIKEIEGRLKGGAPSTAKSTPSTGGSAGNIPGLFNDGNKSEPPAKEKPAKGFSWQSLLEAVRSEKALALATTLENAVFESIDHNILTISVQKGSIYHDQLQHRPYHARIEEIASKLHGSKVKLRIHGKEGSTAVANAVSETDLDKVLKKEAKEHPLVKGAQEILEATIEDIRPKNKSHSSDETN